MRWHSIEVSIPIPSDEIDAITWVPVAHQVEVHRVSRNGDPLALRGELFNEGEMECEECCCHLQ
jgi:hypothetical protein